MRLLLFALVLSLTVHDVANAQGILDRARRAVTGSSASSPASEARSARRAGTPAPAPVYGIHLNHMDIDADFGGPYLKFAPNQFVFLNVRQDDEGTADLFRDGERVAGFTWTVTASRPPFSDISRLQLSWPEFHPLGYEIEAPGQYELVYSANGETFWRMPFEITAEGGDDPYNPSVTYRLEGPWRDHAYLLHDRGGEGAWDFKLWLHAADFTRSERYDVTGDFEVFVYREGRSRPVLGYQSGASFTNNGNWVRTGFRLRKPVEYFANTGAWDMRSHLSYDHFLPEDGEYRIEFSIGGELYGTYPVTVRDGMPVMTGRQSADTDPQRRIDGGGVAYWVYRE
ncbi:MAG: hypothetical protein AAF791_15220 [Bacteroidota bacterium]